jgi:hypothetical protein
MDGGEPLMNRLLKQSIISLLFLCAGCKPNIVNGFYHGFYWKKAGNSWFYFTPRGEQWARVDSESGIWHLQGDCVGWRRIHLESRWDTRDDAFRAAEQSCHNHRCEAEHTCDMPSKDAWSVSAVEDETPAAQPKGEAPNHPEASPKPVVLDDDDVEQPEAVDAAKK